MPTIKIKNPDGSWKYVNEPSSNADTLDGKHADEFALKTELPEEITSEDALELLAATGIVDPAAAADNSILVDENENILLI